MGQTRSEEIKEAGHAHHGEAYWNDKKINMDTMIRAGLEILCKGSGTILWKPDFTPHFLHVFPGKSQEATFITMDGKRLKVVLTVKDITNEETHTDQESEDKEVVSYTEGGSSEHPSGSSSERGERADSGNHADGGEGQGSGAGYRVH